MPSYLKDWLRGIVAAGERKGGSTGVVVWKAPNARDDDAVVVLRLRDWQDWHGVEDNESGSEKPAGYHSDGPLDFVHGVAENGWDEHLEHTTGRLGPSATGPLVNSKPKGDSRWKPKPQRSSTNLDTGSPGRRDTRSSLGAT